VLNLDDQTAVLQKLDSGGAITVAQKRAQSPALKPGMPTATVEFKQEALPSEVIDGVTCEHLLQTETIPAGAIGNERPLIITSETWASPELHLLVRRKRNDPRFGETNYTLTGIKRNEPDPALFRLPGNFKVVEEIKPIRSIR
jgi:hypothetical protein